MSKNQKDTIIKAKCLLPALKEKYIINTPAINALSSHKTYKGEDKLKNEIVYNFANGQGQISIKSKKEVNEQVKKFDPNVVKVLYYIIFLFTKQNNKRQNPEQIINEIEVSVKDYKQEAGLTYNGAKKALRKGIETIIPTNIKFTGKVLDDKRRVNLATLTTNFIYDSLDIHKKGKIIINFAPKFSEYLINSGYLTWLPENYFRLDSTSFQICNKLIFYARTNEKKNKKKKRKCSILSVLKLLEACDAIPRYEKVIGSKDRNTNRRIITPLEKGLDECKRLRILKSWEYCNAKGKPLFKEQLDGINKAGNLTQLQPPKKDRFYLKWDNYKKLNIKYEVNEPIETEAIHPQETIPKSLNCFPQSSRTLADTEK